MHTVVCRQTHGHAQIDIKISVEYFLHVVLLRESQSCNYIQGFFHVLKCMRTRRASRSYLLVAVEIECSDLVPENG